MSLQRNKLTDEISKRLKGITPDPNIMRFTPPDI